MKKFIPVVLILLLFSSLAFAESLGSEMEALNADLEGQVIPAPLDKLFSDERINVHFSMEDDTEVVMGLITSNGKFSSLTQGELEDSSLNVYVAKDVMAEIDSSENPGEVLQSALKDGRIRYEAVGFFNKIKFAAINAMIKVGGWFSGESEPEELEEVVEVEEEIVEVETKKTEEVQETEEPVVAEEEETEEIEEVEVEEEAKTHIVKLTNDGFDQIGTLKINVGETVEWSNVRTGSLKKAMIIGTQACSKAKSTFFEPGESFSWTFEEPVTCLIVDGVYTTETMKLEVK
jgi:hypothetical protein